MSHRYNSRPPEVGNYPNSIKEEALNIGLNVSNLARVIDVSEMTAYDICSGKRLPSFITERKLESIFKKPISEMYTNVYDNLRINWDLIPKVDE